MKWNLSLKIVTLFACVLAIAGCQKMDRPALGDYPPDANPPGDALDLWHGVEACPGVRAKKSRRELCSVSLQPAAFGHGAYRSTFGPPRRLRARSGRAGLSQLGSLSREEYDR